MNAIQENTVLFPKMKADKSGVIRQRYSNVVNYGSTANPALAFSPSEMAGMQNNGTTTTGTGSNAQGWVDTVSGLINTVVSGANGIIGNINQGKFGTDAYNNAQAAMYNSQNKTESKNTGLIIAIVVVALLMVVGFGILIAKK